MSNLKKVNKVLKYIKDMASYKPFDSIFLIKLDHFDDLYKSEERISPIVLGEILDKLSRDYNYISSPKFTEGYMHFKLTDHFIWEFGHQLKVAGNHSYIDSKSVQEIISLSHSIKKLDLTRLIYLLRSINILMISKKYLEALALQRIFLDHVPSIYGLDSFEKVVNNIGRPSSDKKRLEHLQKSLKKSADKYLHERIGKSAQLPDKYDVDYSQDVNLLVTEVLEKLRSA